MTVFLFISTHNTSTLAPKKENQDERIDYKISITGKLNLNDYS